MLDGSYDDTPPSSLKQSLLAGIQFPLSGTPSQGFTISSSPSALTIAQGSSGTDTITVTDSGGFTGSVTLAASNLPSGVTATFATNPTTGASALTLAVSASAPQGSTTITITGTSGALNPATTTIALTIGPSTGGGFTLSASPATLSIAQGGTAAETITVTDTGGFTGTVTISTVTGIPSGVAATGCAPITGNGSCVLMFTASSSASGSGTISVTGTSGALTESTTFGMIVTTRVPPGFTLAASPTSLSVTQGKMTTDAITVADVGGFSGSVTLAASTLPSGVTASFSTNPTASSSVVTFTASSTAAAGAYTAVITGTSGTLTPVTIAIPLTVVSSGPTGFACHIGYTISSQWGGGFGAAITINNTGTTAISNWTLTWAFANGQTITQLWNGTETQSGANVTVTSLNYNGSIPAGGSYTGMGFNGSWNNTTNSAPASFAVNGTTCK